MMPKRGPAHLAGVGVNLHGVVVGVAAGGHDRVSDLLQPSQAGGEIGLEGAGCVGRRCRFKGRGVGGREVQGGETRADGCWRWLLVGGAGAGRGRRVRMGGRCEGHHGQSRRHSLPAKG
jgi:hypothetical protein